MKGEGFSVIPGIIAHLDFAIGILRTGLPTLDPMVTRKHFLLLDIKYLFVL